MLKRAAPLFLICLVAANAAQAQSSGGRGHGGGRGGHPPGGSASAPRVAPAAKPFAEPEIIGVVKLIDPDAGRITIAYEPVDALDWPAGTQPFVVSRTSLLKDLTVGEKVRFKLESQQIASILPF
jgi:Cu/Ag efflux protein CusF